MTWDNSNLAKIYKEIGREEGIAEGIEKGIEKGKAEGIAEAIERGIEKGKAEMIVRFLRKRFGTLSEDYVEKIREQNDAVLETIADTIFEINDVEQLNDYLK
ncbi:DUF4351 domain-containing protein [Mahella sp.]|uniref:DUF4351 domain-containing protein n=1 Tax=Mahella sp. TaxID=2798721 RepID=UPI0025C4C929|nr:DUF4351 domain-containing protein [Mahella sp.]MBZ4664862.1 hypothetical protein [Mahella sp.]